MAWGVIYFKDLVGLLIKKKGVFKAETYRLYRETVTLTIVSCVKNNIKDI